MAWRKQQLVDVPGRNCRRMMRQSDAARAYGIKVQTWHGWEKWPDEPGFRCPDLINMERLFKITGGQVTPDAFYALENWHAELTDSGG
jgi:hypothetical protein